MQQCDVHWSDMPRTVRKRDREEAGTIRGIGWRLAGIQLILPWMIHN